MPDEFKLEYRYTDWIILCQYGSPAVVLNFSRAGRYYYLS